VTWSLVLSLSIYYEQHRLADCMPDSVAMKAVVRRCVEPPKIQTYRAMSSTVIVK